MNIILLLIRIGTIISLRLFIKFSALLLSSIILTSFFLNVNKITIYAYKDTPDFLQIFSYINSEYNEKNSYRSISINKNITEINFQLNSIYLEKVRLDPSNDSLPIFIESIKLHTLFRDIELKGDNLLNELNSLQNIKSINRYKDGIIITGASNDPSFEIIFYSKIKFLSYLIFIFLSLISTYFCIKFTLLHLGVNRYFQNQFPPLVIILLSLLATFIITIIFYPGFMSYDSLHALRGARFGVTDSIWPPMVSYVWMFVDLFSTDPSLMHFLQVAILLTALVSIVYFFTKSIWCGVFFLLCYLSIPVILGTVAVIWKDVLMAAFFFLGLLFSILINSKNSKLVNFIYSLLVIIFLFIGICSRHNAITAAVPIIFYFSFKICKEFIFNKIRLVIFVSLLSSALIGFLFVLKLFIDSYSLPTFKPLPQESSKFIIGTRILDIAGASVCAKKSFFNEINIDLPIEKIMAEYDPRHINLSASILAAVGYDDRVNDLWLKVLINHPHCLLYNKVILTKYLIGANNGEQFLITSPGIDSNEFGIKLSPSNTRDSIVDYINNYSKLILFKPWLIYFLALLLTIISFVKKHINLEQFTIIISSLFYFSGIVIFGNAADARLLFYTTSGLFLSAFISIYNLIFKLKN